MCTRGGWYVEQRQLAGAVILADLLHLRWAIVSSMQRFLSMVGLRGPLCRYAGELDGESEVYAGPAGSLMPEFQGQQLPDLLGPVQAT